MDVSCVCAYVCANAYVYAYTCVYVFAYACVFAFAYACVFTELRGEPKNTLKPPCTVFNHCRLVATTTTTGCRPAPNVGLKHPMSTGRHTQLLIDCL